MNRQTILTFGRRGFGHGTMTNYPGVLFKTVGVAGIIQPYNMYIPDHVNNPYIQRTLLTSPKPDEIQKTKKLVSTEYMKGHGEDSTKQDTTSEPETNNISETCQKACTEEVEKSAECLTGAGYSEAITEASNNPVPITEKQFKRKLESLESDDEEKNSSKKNKKKHKFSLI